MVRTYRQKNLWRRDAKLSPEESEKLFLAMISGLSIKQISDKTGIPLLTCRDNYEYFLDKLFSHDLSLYLLSYLFNLLAPFTPPLIDDIKEMVFWASFPFSTEREYYECTYECAWSPHISELLTGLTDNDLKALVRKLSCQSCPFRLHQTNRAARFSRIAEHAIFLRYMKRIRGKVEYIKFQKHLRLFKAIMCYRAIKSWMPFVNHGLFLEFENSRSYHLASEELKSKIEEYVPYIAKELIAFSENDECSIQNFAQTISDLLEIDMRGIRKVDVVIHETIVAKLGGASIDIFVSLLKNEDGSQERDKENSRLRTWFAMNSFREDFSS